MGSLPPAPPGSPLILLLPLFPAGLPGLVKGLGGQGQVTDESSVWIPVAWMRYQLCSAQDGAGHVPAESLSPGCLLGPGTARERPSGHSPWVERRATLCAKGSCKPSPGTALPPSAIQPDYLAWQGLLRWAPCVPEAAETWHPQAASAPPSRSSLFCTGALALVNLRGLHVTCLF